MAGSDFEFENDSRASDVAGSPEGDGDFETDNLPSTGETSSGGQVTLDGQPGLKKPAEADTELHGLMKVIDEVSSGKIQP